MCEARMTYVRLTSRAVHSNIMIEMHRSEIEIENIINLIDDEGFNKTIVARIAQSYAFAVQKMLWVSRVVSVQRIQAMNQFVISNVPSTMVTYHLHP